MQDYVSDTNKKRCEIRIWNVRYHYTMYVKIKGYKRFNTKLIMEVPQYYHILPCNEYVTFREHRNLEEHSYTVKTTLVQNNQPKLKVNSSTSIPMNT